MIYKINIRLLRVGKKKADWLQTTGPKEQLSSKPPGFSFLPPIIPLDAGDIGNLEMSMNAEKRKVCSL